MDGCCCIIACRMWVNNSFDLQRFSLSLDGISVAAQQRHAERVLTVGCARRVASAERILSVWCWEGVSALSGVQIAFVLQLMIIETLFRLADCSAGCGVTEGRSHYCGEVREEEVVVYGCHAGDPFETTGK
jgi:hypothetical protein